jgi:hypothetical protein
MRTATALISIILFTSLVSAASLSINNVYDQGETIIISIEGNVLESIDRSQVEFKRGHVSIPLEYDIVKVGDSWHAWALAPLANNNYSVTISDIVITQNNQPTLINFSENFSVSENKTDYAVKPGAIDISDEAIFTAISYLDTDQVIKVAFEDPDNPNPATLELGLKDDLLIGESYTLEPGENTLTLSLNGIGQEQRTIQIGMYDVPAFLRGDGSAENQNDNQDPIIIHGLTFLPKRIERSVLIPESREIFVTYPLVVQYHGEDDLEDLDWIYNDEIFNIDDLPEILEGGETYPLEITLIGFDESGFDEIIRLESGNFSQEIPFIITFTEEEDQADDIGDQNAVFSCEQLEGSVCSTNQICNGDIESSTDGSCCIGLCEEPEKPKSKSVWGWILALIIGIIILLAAIKYRRAGKGRDRLKERVAKV